MDKVWTISDERKNGEGLFSESEKQKKYAPIPDFGKVGEVFKTEDRFLLVMDKGKLMDFTQESFESIEYWRGKLSNIGKEVKLKLTGDLAREHIDITYDDLFEAKSKVQEESSVVKRRGRCR